MFLSLFLFILSKVHFYMFSVLVAVINKVGLALEITHGSFDLSKYLNVSLCLQSPFCDLCRPNNNKNNNNNKKISIETRFLCVGVLKRILKLLHDFLSSKCQLSSSEYSWFFSADECNHSYTINSLLDDTKENSYPCFDMVTSQRLQQWRHRLYWYMGVWEGNGASARSQVLLMTVTLSAFLNWCR